MIDHFSRFGQITRSDRINLNVTGLDGNKRFGQKSERFGKHFHFQTQKT
jgi:hypothetical protein